MGWFLYDNDLRHERVKQCFHLKQSRKISHKNTKTSSLVGFWYLSLTISLEFQMRQRYEIAGEKSKEKQVRPLEKTI